jgi:murein DD-endopeptidase MepM/ murein hydrolase activator NlpD
MRPIVKPGIPGLAPSRARWLQLAACGLLAWAWYRADHAPPVEPPLSDLATRIPPPGATPAASIPQAASHPAPVSYSTIEVIVGRNDTLDRIFRQLELDLADLASLRALPGLRAQLDRLYPGEALTVRHRDGALIGLERRLSASETLRVRREPEGFAADVQENPLEVSVRTAHGVIESSLFQAAGDARISDQTALTLAEIFGWDIDFVLDIRPGDEFAVTYEEQSQDGEYVGDGPILAARFVNQGREFRAVRYVGPRGDASYYTPEGRSLRKAFLRAPLQFTRVSSRFNPNRRHPVLNTIRAHKGVDYAAPIGTPVRAAGDGRVRFVGRKGGYGNAVEIDHSRGVVTLYGHLSRFARGIRGGTRVQQGQVIAYVGMTGLASGPHLHYEYRVNGACKNPQTVPLPAATPIDAALLADFQIKTAPYIASLEPADPVVAAAR